MFLLIQITLPLTLFIIPLLLTLNNQLDLVLVSVGQLGPLELHTLCHLSVQRFLGVVEFFEGFDRQMAYSAARSHWNRTT